ncbi:MAG: hypothetical protein R6U89_02235 [Dehalococcoidia bacterium]
MKIRGILALLLTVSILATMTSPVARADGENERFFQDVEALMDRGNDVSKRVAIYEVWKRFEKDGNPLTNSILKGLDEAGQELAVVEALMEEYENYLDNPSGFLELKCQDILKRLDDHEITEGIALTACNEIKGKIKDLADEIIDKVADSTGEYTFGEQWNKYKQRTRAIRGKINERLSDIAKAFQGVEMIRTFANLWSYHKAGDEIGALQDAFGAIDGILSIGGSADWNFVSAYFSGFVFGPAATLLGRCDQLKADMGVSAKGENISALTDDPSSDPQDLDGWRRWPGDNAAFQEAPFGGDGKCFHWDLGQTYACEKHHCDCTLSWVGWCDDCYDIYQTKCVKKEGAYYGDEVSSKVTDPECGKQKGSCEHVKDDATKWVVGAACVNEGTRIWYDDDDSGQYVTELREGESLVDPDYSNDEPPQGAHAQPGQTHPDDTYDVSVPPSLPIDISGTCCATTPRIAVLNRGFATGTGMLLYSMGREYDLVDVGFASSLSLLEYPVLIIPSGGLYGLDSLPSLRSSLQQYVKYGGTIIVFSQARGYEYSVLPGGELSGFGYLEDENCRNRSVGISTYHPILSGQDSVVSDLNVDGFFTAWPENAEILLTYMAAMDKSTL